MKRIYTDFSFIRIALSLSMLAAQFGCANTRPVKLYYVQQDPEDIQIEQPKDGISQKRFDQKIAEINAKARGNPAIIITADSLINEQAKYCDKRNDVEFFTAGLLFSASLFGHYFWYRSINKRNENVTEQGGMTAGIEMGALVISFTISLPLEFFIFPKLASRALVGPRVKPANEKELRKLIRSHNSKILDTQDSL